MGIQEVSWKATQSVWASTLQMYGSPRRSYGCPCVLPGMPRATCGLPLRLLGQPHAGHGHPDACVGLHAYSWASTSASGKPRIKVGDHMLGWLPTFSGGLPRSCMETHTHSHGKPRTTMGTHICKWAITFLAGCPRSLVGYHVQRLGNHAGLTRSRLESHALIVVAHLRNFGFPSRLWGNLDDHSPCVWRTTLRTGLMWTRVHCVRASEWVRVDAHIYAWTHTLRDTRMLQAPKCGHVCYAIRTLWASRRYAGRSRAIQRERDMGTHVHGIAKIPTPKGSED